MVVLDAEFASASRQAEDQRRGAAFGLLRTGIYGLRARTRPEERHLSMSKKKSKNPISLGLERNDFVVMILEQLRAPNLQAKVPGRGTCGCEGQLSLHGVPDNAALAKAIDGYRDSFVSSEAVSKAENAFREFLASAIVQQEACSRLTTDQHNQLVERIKKEFPGVKYDIFTNFPG
jgi:hypothetical protein